MDNGGPSITARRVAAHRLGFARVPAPYGDPAADLTLAADVAAGHEAPASRLHDYLAARTAFFDRFVTGGIGRGVRQVVVGAAGYDGRAFRYAKPGVRWFEVDHPATQQDKLQRLERLGLDASHIRFAAADFTSDPLAERLLAAGLDPAEPSLFLLEGVAVYLEPAVLETVLDQFREVAADGSRLAISMSLSGAVSAARRARFQASVAAMGEPARSSYDAEQAELLLARTGWRFADAPSKDPAAPESPARRERRRSAGLLTAIAAPRAPSAATATPAASSRASSATPTRASTVSRRARSPQPTAYQPPQGPLPLPVLLSHALVAYTIEFDNEAEHRLPHRTTTFGPSAHGDGLWLVSLVMWENCMRFVTDEPVTVGELRRLARTGTNLDGMRRWGYITIDGTSKKIHQGFPGANAVLRATSRGLRTRETWLPLAGLIEQRWQDRYGAGEMRGLRDLLLALVTRLDPGLPDCLPILGHNLRSRGPDPDLPPRPADVDPAVLPLHALLSRVLLSFAVEYERESAVSLAAGANLLRVLGPDGTRLRDLPPRSGISKEAVSWALGGLVQAGLAAEEPDPAASRGKVARLTLPGVRAQTAYHETLGVIEERWQERFTPAAIAALRQTLEPLAATPATPATPGASPPPLFRALEPYPDNWRAQTRPPATLPYYPMVLHRGGYPDGS